MVNGRTMIVDCDPGIDDALALLSLAGRCEAEIDAIGTVHGNTGVAQAAENALQVCDVAGWNVPVAVGARAPLNQPLHLSPDVHGHDGLGGQAGTTGRETVEESAAQQLVRLARERPGQYTILALGPLTNLAQALHLEPRLPELVREVVVMGGAVAAPGNITPVGEANIVHDPEAADHVLTVGWPVTLVGLDVTAGLWLGPSELDRISAGTGERAKFATSVLRHYVDFYTARHGRKGCALHDPATAVLALNPSLATCSELPVRVELRGEHTRGMTVADRRDHADDGPRVRVATDVDAAGVLTAFLEGLLC